MRGNATFAAKLMLFCWKLMLEELSFAYMRVTLMHIHKTKPAALPPSTVMLPLKLS